MVNKKPPTDSSSGMNFDTSQETTNMRQETSWQPKLVLPQEMSQAMEPQRVQAGIAQDNLN